MKEKELEARRQELRGQFQLKIEEDGSAALDELENLIAWLGRFCPRDIELEELEEVYQAAKEIYVALKLLSEKYSTLKL